VWLDLRYTLPGSPPAADLPALPLKTQ
jgi:hypothetical protein